MLKRLLQNTVLIVASILSGLVIVEIGLRVVGISNPSFYTVDEHRGAALRPGASGWWTKEGKAYIRINSDGLRDRERDRAKPKNTLRIAVLGDSYAEALQVPIEKTFWSMMERHLNNCEALAGQQVEAINFGVSGYGTAQELLTLRHHVWDYSPDIILLAFLAGNDIRNNSRHLEQDEMRPYFIEQNGELVLDNSFRTSTRYRRRQYWHWQLVYQAINYSRILKLLGDAVHIQRNRLAASQNQNTPPEKATAEPTDDCNQDKSVSVAQTPPVKTQEAGLDNAIYREPTAPEWQVAWRVTERLIALMNREIRKSNASFLVVTLTNGGQVHPDAAIRQNLMQQLGIEDLFYSERRIKTLGQQEDFPVLTLAETFQAYAEENQACLHGFENASPCGGHWNEAGHRLAGEIIAQHLCIQWENL